MKIGFFDSGLGGLIMLKAVAKQLPQYDYEFYGDTAHVPYGDRTEEDIYKLTKAGVEHLFERDCSLVIIACNTASAETLRKLQDTILVGEYKEHRILGVIIPTVEAITGSRQDKVRLFATKRTVDSGKYGRELQKLRSPIELSAVALPGLVPLIEAGKDAKALEHVLSEVRTAKTAGITAIILGCTHYSLLKDGIREEMGGEGEVFSQDEIIPKKLEDYLHRHPEIENTLSRNSSRNIFLTAHKPEYDSVIKHLMGGVVIPGQLPS